MPKMNGFNLVDLENSSIFNMSEPEIKKELKIKKKKYNFNNIISAPKCAKKNMCMDWHEESMFTEEFF